MTVVRCEFNMNDKMLCEEREGRVNDHHHLDIHFGQTEKRILGPLVQILSVKWFCN